MKINRNDACLCGSKKKYKNCCGSKSSGNESNQLVRSLILSAILLIAVFFYISPVIEFYQEDQPEMETYECDNPNCGKVHSRKVVSPTQSN